MRGGERANLQRRAHAQRDRKGGNVTTHLLLGNRVNVFLQALQVLLQAARVVEIDANLFEQLVDLRRVGK